MTPSSLDSPTNRIGTPVIRTSSEDSAESLNRKNIAAAKITSLLRGITTRNHIQNQHVAATKIQQCFRMTRPPIRNSVVTFRNISEVLSNSQSLECLPTQDYINPNKVMAYVKRMKAGEEIEPIEEFTNTTNGKKYLLDGHHRYIASQISGIPVSMEFAGSGALFGFPSWKYAEQKTPDMDSD